MKIKSQKGNLSIDFLFSLVLVLGLTTVIFALSFTLSMVEVTQYFSYSVSRSYFSSHVNQEAQFQLAKQKYQQLSEVPAFRFMFKANGNWFVLTNPEEFSQENLGDFREEYFQEAKIPNDADTFIGARIRFIPKLLNFELPYFGSTNPDSQRLEVNIQSFLGREPSSEECMLFQVERFNRIINYYPDSGAQGPGEIYADNGC